jgi:hypothetical protein
MQYKLLDCGVRLLDGGHVVCIIPECSLADSNTKLRLRSLL